MACTGTGALIGPYADLPADVKQLRISPYLDGEAQANLSMTSQRERGDLVRVRLWLKLREEGRTRLQEIVDFVRLEEMIAWQGFIEETAEELATRRAKRPRLVRAWTQWQKYDAEFDLFADKEYDAIGAAAARDYIRRLAEELEVTREGFLVCEGFKQNGPDTCEWSGFHYPGYSDGADWTAFTTNPNWEGHKGMKFLCRDCAEAHSEEVNNFEQPALDVTTCYNDDCDNFFDCHNQNCYAVPLGHENYADGDAYFYCHACVCNGYCANMIKEPAPSAPPAAPAPSAPPAASRFRLAPMASLHRDAGG